MASFLPFITGGAGAIVVLCLWVYAFYTGKIHSTPEFTRLEQENTQLRAENSGYRAALATERRAVNETAQAGQVTNQLITALTSIAGERLAPAQPAPAQQGLPAGDPG